MLRLPTSVIIKVVALAPPLTSPESTERFSFSLALAAVLGSVDHVQGSAVKLVRDVLGQHHFVPIVWIGVYPQPLLTRLNAPVGELLRVMQAKRAAAASAVAVPLPITLQASVTEAAR